MSFFPLYLNMDSKKVLLVGAGSIATHKLEKLLDFTSNVHIVSLNISEEAQKLIRQNDLTLYQRAYQVGDIKGFDIVIIATDDEVLHQKIYEESRGLGILVNSVDNMKYCDFIFPSYLQKGDLTVAFSTGGASPAFAKKIRQHFEKNIPHNVEAFLTQMKALRKTMPKGKARIQYFDGLVNEYFNIFFK
jgi:precorrin-2 dehydrogenase/sirohydrochlorin ferrochelatase